jgi:small lipoprotein (TIGR04454 family)
MKKIQRLFVAASLASLAAACGGEKKAEPTKTPDQPQTAPTPTPTTPTPGPMPAGKGLGALGGLLGGGPRQAAAPTRGLLGGLGLGGGVLGGGVAVAAKAGEAGAPPATPVAVPVGAPTATPPATGGNPGCQQVAAHLGKILEQEIKAGKAQGAELDIDPAMIAQMVPMIAMTCEQGAWPPEAQACILAAADTASIQKCESLVPGAGGSEDGDTGDLGDDTDDVGGDTGDVPMPDMGGMSNTPVPSGDAECDQLAGQVLTALMSTMAPEEAQAIGAMKVALQNEIAKECATAPWPKEMRTCLAGAKTQADMEKCAGAM